MPPSSSCSNAPTTHGVTEIPSLPPCRQIRQPHGECLHLGTAPGALNLSPLLGHAHAASGLLHVAAGALYGFLGVWPDGAPWTSEERAVVVELTALAGQQQQIVLVPPDSRAIATPTSSALCSRRPPDPTRGSARRCIFPVHLPDVRLPNHAINPHISASGPEDQPAYAAQSVPVSAGATNSDDLPPTPIRTATAGRRTDTSQLEHPMTTHLPVPPALPNAADAYMRVPLGADAGRADASRSRCRSVMTSVLERPGAPPVSCPIATALLLPGKGRRQLACVADG